MIGVVMKADALLSLNRAAKAIKKDMRDGRNLWPKVIPAMEQAIKDSFRDPPSMRSPHPRYVRQKARKYGRASLIRTRRLEKAVMGRALVRKRRTFVSVGIRTKKQREKAEKLHQIGYKWLQWTDRASKIVAEASRDHIGSVTSKHLARAALGVR